MLEGASYFRKRSKMSKHFVTIGYVLAFLVVCGFLLGWKFYIAAERPENIADYQKRLSITAENISAPAAKDNPDDALRVYAVNIVEARPFKDPSITYGVYLGQGLVLTAAHMTGRFPFAARPHVLIAGQDLPAVLIKVNASEQIDLALLSVDQERLPVALRLRRNPLCIGNFQIGASVTVAYLERTVRSQIISPLLIAPQRRTKFATLINDAQGAGAGIFNTDKKCLLGLVSLSMTKFAYRKESWRMTTRADGYASYFVPAALIANFVRPELGF